MREARKRLGRRDICRSFSEMNWSTQCAVVIPCLNEAESIGEVVRSAGRFVDAVFVIDDGSSDDTGAVAKSAGAEVLRHALPRGKGAALQSGWALARERGFRWALAMDGDGQHAAEDIPKFFEPAERSGAALVVGNRMEQPDGMPRVRRWVNRWMSERISALAGMPLPDSQCGFRLMSLDTWAALPVSAAHFEIESDVLLAFARGGGLVEFVPIAVIYKNERSKIHPVRDTVRWFRWWWGACLYRGTGSRRADWQSAKQRVSNLRYEGNREGDAVR
jgi:glycosyltransferase involved in cell wall biosynthesis